MSDRLSVTVSLAMKVNLGNYESAEAFVSVSGLTDTTTDEEIDELLEGPGKIAYEKLKERLRERVRDLRAGGAR